MVQQPVGDEHAGATIAELAPHSHIQLGIAVRPGAESPHARASRSTDGNPQRSLDAKRSAPAHRMPQSAHRTPRAGLPEHERPRRGCRSAIDEATHQERQRLAGLLEDRLQQLLITARLGVVQAQRRARTGGGQSGAVIGEALSGVEDLLQQSLLATRDLVADLNAPATEGPELIKSLRWLARAMEERYDQPVTVSTTLPVLPVSEGLRHALFGSVREALLTALSPAGPSGVTVEVSMADGQVQIVVSGHEPLREGAQPVAQGAQGPGSRLRAIKGQLRDVRGSASIDSHPSDGTRVAIRAPLA
jgi:signal transduction histidine kinase